MKRFFLSFFLASAFMIAGANAYFLHLNVNVAGGGTCPQGSAFADGCPGAPTPAGPIQYPSVLNSYAHRPPWNVPGIDYYVGVPQKTLTPWTTAFAACLSHPNVSGACTVGGAGWEWDNGPGNLRCDSGKAALDSIDFTAGSTGMAFYLPNGGCTGFSITNSKLGCNASQGFGGINGQLTGAYVFKNDTFDWSSCLGQGGTLRFGDIGCSAGPPSGCSLDYEYNVSENNQVDQMHIGGNLDNAIIKYNLFHNFTRAVGDPSVHMNAFEWGSGTVSASTISFNSFWVDTSVVGGQEVQYYSNPGTFANPTLTNNVFPASGCGCISDVVNGPVIPANPSTFTGTGTDTANYFDHSFNTPGNVIAYYPGTMAGFNNSGNIDMNTGGTVTPP